MFYTHFFSCVVVLGLGVEVLGWVFGLGFLVEPWDLGPVVLGLLNCLGLEALYINIEE